MAKYETPGRDALKALDLGASAIAARFGKDDETGKDVVNQSTVSRWLSGDSRPDTRCSSMLEALFGIPASTAWLTHEEAEQQRKALARTGTDGDGV